MKFSLNGTMIPRQVRRMFEQRDEARIEPDPDSALLSWRGETQVVRLGNVSPSGAMLWFDGVPHIGERVALQMLDRKTMPGQVRWVRDGRIGINFSGPRG
jgi:hypothetical protein